MVGTAMSEARRKQHSELPERIKHAASIDDRWNAVLREIDPEIIGAEDDAVFSENDDVCGHGVPFSEDCEDCYAH